MAGYFPPLTPFASFLPTILAVYIIYIGLRLYVTIFLGVSLGQFIMGIRACGSFSWKRVGGAGRVLFGAILWPFLIFDLPLLWQRKTIKELLSFTRLKFEGMVMPVISTVIIVPALIVISLFSPLLENLTLIDGVKVEFSMKKKSKVDNQTNFKSFKSYNSNFFKFAAFSSLGDGRFLLLPSFEVIHKGKVSKVNPFLMIYDRETFQVTEMKITKRINLFDLLSKAKTGNPLFYAKYPQLFKAMGDDQSNFEIQKYQTSFRKKTLLKRGVQSEIEQLIQSSFELSLKNALGHLIANGPFVRGYVIVRNELLSLLDRDSIPEVDLVEIGNYRFLKMNLITKREVEKRVETYIPLGTMNGVVLQMVYPNSLDAKRSRAAFNESFLGMIDWHFDYKDIFDMPTKKDFGPLSIVDYFAQGGLDKKLRLEFEDYIYEFFFVACRESLMKDDTKLQQALLTALNRHHMVALLKKGYYSERFVSFLKTLKIYLKTKNRGYFNY